MGLENLIACLVRDCGGHNTEFYALRHGQRVIIERLGIIMSQQDDILNAVNGVKAVTSDVLAIVTQLQNNPAPGVDTSSLAPAVDGLQQADAALDAIVASMTGTPVPPDAGDGSAQAGNTAL